MKIMHNRLGRRDRKIIESKKRPSWGKFKRLLYRLGFQQPESGIKMWRKAWECSEGYWTNLMEFFCLNTCYICHRAERRLHKRNCEKWANSTIGLMNLNTGEFTPEIIIKDGVAHKMSDQQESKQ